MIENTLWMTYFEYLPIELKQAEEEGKNVELYRKEIEEIIQTSGDMSFEEKERKAWEILDRIEKEPIKREFPYQEPNEIEKIEELRNTELRRNFTVDQATIEDRVWGAWLGRCIGCLLGQYILQICETAFIRNAVSFFCNIQKFLIFIYDIHLINIRMFTVDSNEFKPEA